MPDNETTPQWLVERLAANELRPAEAAEVRRRLEAEGGLHRLEAIERDDQKTLAALPPSSVMAEVRRRARVEQAHQTDRGRRPRRWGFAALAATAAMCLVSVGVWRIVADPLNQSVRYAEPEETRSKGARPHLILHRKTAHGGAETVAPDTTANEGEVLQISYVAAGRTYGAILSIDGRGSVTRHLPQTGVQPAPLTAGGTVPLEQSYRLDDAPELERFFFVTSDRAFDVAAVEQALRSLAATDPRGEPQLPDGTDVSTFALNKGSK